MGSSIFCLLFFLALNLPSLSMAYDGYNNVESSSSLEIGFYRSTCPSAEATVERVVNKAIAQNPRLGAALIRMHFHDCFVRGCDASILLDSTPGNPAEKDNKANNPSLQGYEVIDEAKAELEACCPQTVSCADIIAFAARDSVSKLGPGISYEVEAGRRDGRISLKDDPNQNIPAPFFNLTQLEQSFQKKGLSLEEMVVLSGAHSIGVSHCSSFLNRLYSFNNVTNAQDPSLDPRFASGLRAKCPNSNISNPTVPQDFVTPNRLDNEYYRNVENSRVLLTSDQSLMTCPSAASLVRDFGSEGGVWANKFAKAMVRMGAIEVSTGTVGEIRKNCRVVNYY